MKLYDDFFGPKETPEALGEGQMGHEGVTSPHSATTTPPPPVLARRLVTSSWAELTQFHRHKFL